MVSQVPSTPPQCPTQVLVAQSPQPPEPPRADPSVASAVVRVADVFDEAGSVPPSVAVATGAQAFLAALKSSGQSVNLAGSASSELLCSSDLVPVALRPSVMSVAAVPMERVRSPQAVPIADARTLQFASAGDGVAAAVRTELAELKTPDADEADEVMADVNVLDIEAERIREGGTETDMTEAEESCQERTQRKAIERGIVRGEKAPAPPAPDRNVPSRGQTHAAVVDMCSASVAYSSTALRGTAGPAVPDKELHMEMESRDASQRACGVDDILADLGLELAVTALGDATALKQPRSALEERSLVSGGSPFDHPMLHLRYDFFSWHACVRDH